MDFGSVFIETGGQRKPFQTFEIDNNRVKELTVWGVTWMRKGNKVIYPDRLGNYIRCTITYVNLRKNPNILVDS